MKLRRLTLVLLILYGLLTAYTILRLTFDLPYLPGLTPLLTSMAFAIAFLHAGQRMGWIRAALLVGLTFSIALLFESVGVLTGLVYGPYHYTDQLGAKFLGLVPYLIPLAWFMMMLPSFLMAGWLVPRAWTGGKRLIAWSAIGGLIMTSWDLTMDPMMVAAGHWVWEAKGAYFGVPIQNYWGWWLTVFVTFGLFLWITGLQRTPFPNTSQLNPGQLDQNAILLYLITGLGNAITTGLVGLIGPALVGSAAMLVWVVLAWRRTSRESERSKVRAVEL